MSLEVSPLLADDTDERSRQRRNCTRAKRPNLFIKIPGTPDGVPAIEEAIFAGVPINVTLLFSREQYLAAAEATCAASSGASPPGSIRGSSRWPRCSSAAGTSPSKDQVPRRRCATASASPSPGAPTRRTATCSARRAGRALAAAGAQPQRLLWASTGTKDPAAPDTLYVEALAAPDTINTIPEKTLQAFAEHGKLGARMPVDGGDAEAVLAEFARARHRRRRARRAAPARGRRRLRQVVEGPARRIAERRRSSTERPSRERRRAAWPSWLRAGVAGARAHHAEIRALHLRELFASDPGRGERLPSRRRAFISTTRRIASPTRRCGCSSRLAEERGLRERIEAMFRGDEINATEKRAVLHVALRCAGGERLVVDGVDVVAEVHAVLDGMAAFAEAVRSGDWTGPHRQARSATSSTSASAAPTSAR